jgi:DNA-directed RNA polymerase
MTVTQTHGGYVILKSPLVRAGLQKHTTALDRPVSQTDLDALNAIQATPWRINQWILDIAVIAWDREIAAGGLPSAPPPPRPPRVAADLWDAMTVEARKDHMASLSRLRGAAARHIGKRHAALDRLLVAEELRDRESIWFPYTRCFRGRVYPLPTSGPTPQSDDFGKALLMFSEGVPLGPGGFFWLCVRAANCAGRDKLSLEERVAWTLENEGLIRVAADDPLGDGYELWQDFDDPWQFLATCRELVMAWEDTEGFISHLPIAMDGSCNGLQHLAAMGLDPTGASATNLLPGERQDIYSEVAKVVQARVEVDAAAGVEAASAWVGKVTRDVCKRSVMTTPYGVTERGIRQQLLDDQHVPVETKRAAAATYLTTCLVDALGQTVRSAREIMGWLQDTAGRLARAGYPFDWTTPTGSRCRQAYFKYTTRQVITLLGRVSLAEEVPGGLVNIRKQTLGSAPNYVHSFDAAAMTLTVNASVQQGITAFALIHDSYGTHAGNTTLLSVVLRDQFVRMYQDDWLRKTAEDVRSYAPDVPILEPPERGSLDIGAVRDSEFFFS